MQLYDDIGPLTDTTAPPNCDYSHPIEAPPTNPSHPLQSSPEAASQEEQQNLHGTVITAIHTLDVLAFNS